MRGTSRIGGLAIAAAMIGSLGPALMAAVDRQQEVRQVAPQPRRQRVRQDQPIKSLNRAKRHAPAFGYKDARTKAPDPTEPVR